MATKIQKISFWKNLPYKGYFYTSLGLDVATIVIVILTKGFLPPVAPLLYGRPEGASQLIPSIGLIIAPSTALVITLINIFLTKPVKDKFLQQILIVSTFLISLLTTITVLKVIFLVGFF